MRTEWLQRAVALGLLPADAKLPATASRPWPALALTALGAWFVAVPLLAFFAGLFGGLLQQGPMLAGIGLGLLALAVMLLRDPALPVFVEQLALPVLLAGALALAWGLAESLGERQVPMLLGALALALAWVLPRAWLRGLLGLGFALAWLVQAALWHDFSPGGLLPALLLAGLWALGLNLPLPARVARAWSATGAGGMLMLLGALAVASGSPWLATGLAPLGPWQGRVGDASGWATSLGLLGMGAALGWLARRHAALRTPAAALLAGLALAATALLPALGPIGLIAAVAATGGMARLAVAAGFAALWVLGSFYYQLQWPLLHKAGLLAAVAGALGLWAWTQRAPAATGATAAPAGAAWGLLAAALLTVGAANLGIWRKEQLIAQGTPLFVRLAPVDPRSLMQGDYMALRFDLPDEWQQARELPGATRPMLRVRVDAQQRALVWRADDGTPLAADERRVELSPKAGRWVLVTDAWFFAEGEAQRWETARWGEFRVERDGRALLVGLRGEDLRPL